MHLELPDGRELTMDQAMAIVAAYRRDDPAVLDLFDQTNRGPHDEICPLDALALNALNAFGPRPPMTPMTALWSNRSLVESAVVTITKRPLEELAADEIEDELPKVVRALECADSLQWFGWTASSKLLHRLRPNIIPIWDTRVGKWYPGINSWLPWVMRVYSVILIEHNVECLTSMRRSLDVCIPMLRLWDIILWQLVSGAGD